MKIEVFDLGKIKVDGIVKITPVNQKNISEKPQGKYLSHI